ncbi:MAG TPA: G8 domain-containing protein, partial [Pyrinomonadaceae bacterium]
MKRIGSFLAVACCVAAMSVAASAATCNSNNSGAWNTAGNWSCGHVPNAADDVVIATTHAMTYNPGTGTILSLTINGTGSLRFNDNSSDTLTVTGSVTNNGTIFGGDGPGNRTHTLAIGGNFTNNGTLTAAIGDD